VWGVLAVWPQVPVSLAGQPHAREVRGEFEPTRLVFVPLYSEVRAGAVVCPPQFFTLLAKVRLVQFV
jgi:hypothetical protein